MIIVTSSWIAFKRYTHKEINSFFNSTLVKHISIIATCSNNYKLNSLNMLEIIDRTEHQKHDESINKSIYPGYYFNFVKKQRKIHSMKLLRSVQYFFAIVYFSLEKIVTTRKVSKYPN